ncbi:peptide chain release factor aRF-1 [Candidatus Woesearchaeota archaeon]|jgi:peptide chain release factor subunit 1|nr:peptide chain release factor aRF-1 [Candidatus Woesearchaeota archaeon]MBT6520128.1 peptide chain release factor aRF-1 [Candidatus Woesearchaeota archaeon]MBT7366733.1 peptide chain release factor aRF-1 [Candidatus Woesearchaeota archaeon]
MAISEKERFKLKKFVKELAKCRGRHTELVSVYVPAGYDLNAIINHLQQEQGTASNIKSKSTRENVITSLERMIQHLRLFKKTPPNGLAIFSGNVAEREGQQDVKVWSVEPPVPLNFRTYRCDKEFIIEPLQEMTESTEIYGLVVVDQRDAAIAILKGKAIIPLKKTHSEVPGKMRAGGQSAPRFQRLRQGAIKDHFKKVADYMKENFLTMKGLKGIILGGPGTTVNNFLNKDYITGDVRKKIIGTKDLSYTGDFGLQELVDKSQDLLAEEDIATEKALMGKFFTLLSTKPDMVSYGLEQVKKALKMGAVDAILVSEVADEDIIEEFEIIAEQLGSKVEIISTETREGVQLRDMGMFAALLRYPLRE